MAAAGIGRIDAMDESTEEEMAAASSLKSQANELVQAVAFFKVNGAHAAPRMARTAVHVGMPAQ